MSCSPRFSSSPAGSRPTSLPDSDQGVAAGGPTDNGKQAMPSADKAAAARERASSPKQRITAQSPPPAPLGLPAHPASAASAQMRARAGVTIAHPASSPSEAMATAARRTARREVFSDSARSAASSDSAQNARSE